MSEPLSLVLLGSTATEGIKFLYGQASELLTEWRKRWKGDSPEDGDLDVPIISQAVLDNEPAGSTANASVIRREYRELVPLSGPLSPYAQEQVDIAADDEDLAFQGGQLRDLLEAVYGQRLTFRGEQRERTGRIGLHYGRGWLL